MDGRTNKTTLIAVIGSVVLVLILVFGTEWTGRMAKTDTDSAVRTVSLLYLDELAGRREQVVADNIREKINVIHAALELMTEDDLNSTAALQRYQARMRRLFMLEKFAFVDADGLIYTSTGIQDDIDRYPFDYRTLDSAEISVKNLESTDKTVIIAVPVSVPLQSRELVVCFMEIDMQEMLSGVSMNAQEGGATFCNIYTGSGIALSNTVLGGLAVEDNLLEALQKAVFDPGYSYETLLRVLTRGTAARSALPTTASRRPSAMFP